MDKARQQVETYLRPNSRPLRVADQKQVQDAHEAVQDQRAALSGHDQAPAKDPGAAFPDPRGRENRWQMNYRIIKYRKL